MECCRCDVKVSRQEEDIIENGITDAHPERASKGPDDVILQDAVQQTYNCIVLCCVVLCCVVLCHVVMC
jgi:hypothetical protein